MQNGRGIAQDFQEAIKWYTKAAEQGNVNAQYNLGNLYLRGQGASQNDNLAFSWFIKAAEQGDAPAQYNLCLLYTSPSPRDRQKSRMPSSA